MIKKQLKKWTSRLVVTALVLTSVTGFSWGNKVYAADQNVKVPIEVTYGQTEARTILDMINELRTGKDAWYFNKEGSKKVLSDLQPVKYSYELEKVAVLRAAEIALSYSHTRANGGDWFRAHNELGVKSSSSGENIAAGYGSASEVNLGWREDDENYDGQGHRRNMLESGFTSVGIGHVFFNGVDYWVEEFGTTEQGTKTEPNDSKTEVTVDVDNSFINKMQVSSKNNIKAVECGQTIALTEYNVSLQIMNYWNYRSDFAPVLLKPNAKLLATDFAEEKDGVVTVKKPGSFKVQFSIDGSDVSCEETFTASHSVVTDPAVPATYTSTGLTEGKHCKGCGEILEAQKVIPVLVKETPKPAETSSPKPSGSPKPTQKPSTDGFVPGSTGPGNLTDSSITKTASQTISVAKKFKKTVNVKAKQLKKKSLTFKINPKAKGSVTAKLTSCPKNAKKCISVSKKGVVILKKNAKKGIYSITLTAKEIIVNGTYANERISYQKAKRVVRFKVK